MCSRCRAYDGHTLATVIPAIEALIGNALDRVLAGAGHRRHNTPPERMFGIYVAGR